MCVYAWAAESGPGRGGWAPGNKEEQILLIIGRAYKIHYQSETLQRRLARSRSLKGIW